MRFTLPVSYTSGNEKKEEGVVHWQQGFFQYGSKKRNSTFSSIRFIDDTHAVISHRAGAKIFIIRFNLEKEEIEILDDMIVSYMNKNIHLEGVSVYKDSIFFTNFTNIVYTMKYDKTTYKFLPETLRSTPLVDGMEQIQKMFHFHGSFVDKNGILYTGSQYEPNIIAIYDTKDENSQKHIIPFPYNIKSLIVYNEFLLVSAEKVIRNIHRPDVVKDSYILLIGENAQILSSYKLENTINEDITINGNTFFITIHTGEDNNGYIQTGHIDENNQIIIGERLNACEFPHGIDYYNNKLGYTSYGEECIVIENIN